jgi:ribonuclease D
MAEACKALREAGSFAFDTEFVGEDIYTPEICLIQAATDSDCVLIDPMAKLDLSLFWDLVADESVRVIVHAGSEDLSLCWKHFGKPAANVFDLQIGAGLIGLGYPISLMRLAQITIGARLHKSQTLTDWRQRPLTPDQINYAVEDVAHLPAIHRFIAGRLAKLKREPWAAEECTRACRATTAVARGENRLKRLRGTGSLSAKELAIAEALLEERDKLAQEYNRPARTVLRDHLLIEMARRGWTDPPRIRTLRGINLKGAAIQRLIAAIEAGKRVAPEQWPQIVNDEDTPEEEVLLALLTALLRDYCNRNAVSYALLAGKQDLRALVRIYTRSHKPELPILLQSGWRQTAIGDLLNHVLTGERALRITREGDRTGLRVE